MLPPDINTGRSNAGLGEFAGATSFQKRDVIPFIAALWPKGLSSLRWPKIQGGVSRFYEWFYDMIVNANSTPFGDTVDFLDIPQSYTQPRRISNTVRRWAAAIEIGMEAETLKAWILQGGLMDYFYRRELEAIVRGMALQLWCSEFSMAAMGSPPEQFAGMGTTEDGMALRPLAYDKWVTAVAEPTAQGNYIDCGNTPFSQPFFNQGNAMREQKTGLQDGEVHVDGVNQAIVNTWISNEIIQYGAGEYRRENLVTQFTNQYGKFMFVKEVTDYPVGAVWTLGQGKINGKNIREWGPQTGCGLRPMRIPSTANTTRVMILGNIGFIRNYMAADICYYNTART